MLGALFGKICLLIRKIGVGGLMETTRLWSEPDWRVTRQVWRQ